MVKTRAAAALVVCVVAARGAGPQRRRRRQPARGGAARPAPTRRALGAGGRAAGRARRDSRRRSPRWRSWRRSTRTSRRRRSRRRSARGLGAGRAPAGRRAGGLSCWRISATSAARARRRLRCASGLGFLAHPLRDRPVRRGARQLPDGVPARGRAARRPSLDPHAIAGKSRDVGWRAGDAAVREGALYLDGLLRPDDQAVAYVAAFVHSDRDRAGGAADRLAGPGQGLGQRRAGVRRTTWSGRRCSIRTRRRCGSDAAGTESLIKTVVVDGAWRLYARLTEPSGAPLHLGGRRPRAPPPDANGRRGGGASRREGPACVVARCAARAAGEGVARRGGPPRRGSIWRARSPGSRRGIAKRTPPRTPRSDRWRRGRRWAATWWRPRSPTTTTSAAAISNGPGELAISAALARAPAGAPRGAGAHRAARDARDGVLSQRAGARPRLLAGGRWRSPTRSPRRRCRWRRWRGSKRCRPPCRRCRASAGRRPGSTKRPGAAARAIACWRRSRTSAACEVDLLHQLAARARARGDGAEARARLAAAAALRPDLPSLEIELARFDEGAGEGARALAGLTALAARLPDDPSTLIALGKLLHRLGRTDEALVRLRGALALRPAGSRAQTLRRSAGRRRPRRSGRGRRAGAPLRRGGERARAARTRPRWRRRATPRWCCSTGAWCACTRTACRGRSPQRVVEVLTERGAEDNKEFEVHYTPGSEEVDIRQARIYRRDARGGARGAGGDRPQRRGSLRALVRPLLRQPRRGGPLRGAAPGRRGRDPVPGRRRQQREPDGRLLRRSAVRRRDDPQAPLGLHAHRAGEPSDPRQRPARRPARTEDHRRRRRSGLSLRRHRHRQGRRRAGHAGDGGDGALSARQHLRDLGRGRRLVLAPGRGPADRRRRRPPDGARPGDARR